MKSIIKITLLFMLGPAFLIQSSKPLKAHQEFDPEAISPFNKIYMKAAFATNNYQERIKLFEELLACISSEKASSHHHKKFIKSLFGLFYTRNRHNIVNMISLKNLLTKAYTEKKYENSSYETTLISWIKSINKELEPHALKDGDVIRIRPNNTAHYLYIKKSSVAQHTENKLVAGSPGKTAYKSSLFIIKTKESPTVFNNHPLELVPYEHPLKITTTTGNHRGKVCYELELREQNDERISARLTLKKNNTEALAYEPLLPGTVCSLIHEESQTHFFTPPLKEQGRFTHVRLDAPEASNTNHLFCIEKVRIKKPTKEQDKLAAAAQQKLTTIKKRPNILAPSKKLLEFGQDLTLQACESRTLNLRAQRKPTGKEMTVKVISPRGRTGQIKYGEPVQFLVKHQGRELPLYKQSRFKRGSLTYALTIPDGEKTLERTDSYFMFVAERKRSLSGSDETSTFVNNNDRLEIFTAQQNLKIKTTPMLFSHATHQASLLDFTLSTTKKSKEYFMIKELSC